MKTCVICGSELSGRQLVTCSQKCRNKRLTQSEAFKQAVARYRASAKRTVAEKAYYEGVKRERTCAHCGESFKSRRARYCSMACVGASQRKHSTDLVPRVGDPFPRTDRQRLAMHKLVHAAEGSRSRNAVWVFGICCACGEPFTCMLTNTLPTTCSHKCLKQVGRARRRALKKNAYLGDVRRNAVFERDGWRCWLCRRKVKRGAEVPHPLAPVIDHVIPLAAGTANGGWHSMHNVRCAHFICNSRKSDAILNDQPALW